MANLAGTGSSVSPLGSALNDAEKSECHLRQGIWLAMICLAWSALLLALVTLKWTPDCGGVAYGMPLPFVRSFIGSSQEFDLFVGPYLLDILAYAVVVFIPAWLVVRRIRKKSACGWRVSATVVLVPVVLGSALVGTTMLFGARAGFWPREQLYVYEWRSHVLHVGLPTWATHLEERCN